MQALAEVLLFILGIARTIVIIHIIMSWLIQFQVLNLHQPFVAQVWYGINTLLEPIYGPIRRALPNMGGLDLSPIVVFVGIFAAERIIVNYMF